MNIETIIDKLGITPNAMQQDAFNAILHSNKDVVVLSPTGSGKTLAYLLPLVQRLDASIDRVQAVVVVPGRELALQSLNVLKNLGCGLRAMSLYGGRPTMDEHREIRQVRPQIVFATPGRLNDHLDKQNFPVDNLKWMVIDEFDKCLEMGFQEEMSQILQKLPFVDRHILLSATEVEAIPHFVNMGRTSLIDYRMDDEQTPDRVTVYVVKSPQKDKLETLDNLLRALGGGSTIVFLNHRDSVERTASYLCEHGFSVTWFHGGLEQRMREDALYRFSNGSANVLVSTDLASRGLDIPNVDNIIHYHLPETKENYIHRVGRTARWDKEGRSFFLLNAQEEVPSYVEASLSEFIIPPSLPQPAQPKMATLYIGKGKKDKISKGDVVGFLCKKGGLKSAEIGRIDVKERYSYVAISRGKMKSALLSLKGEKIKGVKTVVEPVR